MILRNCVLFTLLICNLQALRSQCNWNTVIADGFEYSSPCPDVLPGIIFHDTPQNFSPHSGNSALYMNIVDGQMGLIYSRTLNNLIVGEEYRLSFWTKDAWDWLGFINLDFNLLDGNGNIIGTQNFTVSGSTWNQGIITFVPTSSSYTFQIFTNVPGGPGNDPVFDDFLLEICDEIEPSAPCIGNINLGNDTTLCPSQSLLLNAGVFESYLWNDGTTTATKNITQAGTYSVIASYLGSNQIINGDFETGNSNFSTEYQIGTGGVWGQLSNEGTYAITTSPDNVHNNFFPCNDFTIGTGQNQMVVNGSSTPNTNIWCQTVATLPNTTYQFGTQVSSVYNTTDIAELQFSINNVNFGNVFSPTNNSCDWSQFTENWFSNLTTSAEICIVNQNTSAGGNDFTIDDITFRPVCFFYDTIVVSNALVEVNAGLDQTICLGQQVTLSANGNGAITTWDQGVLDGIPFAPTATSTYTVTSATGSCIATDQVTVSVTNSIIINAGLDQTICAGEQVILSASGGSTYSWTGGVTNGVAFSPTATSTYSVTGETANSCQNTDEVTITVNPLPTINPIIDLNVCLGNSVTLVASGTGTNYSWSDGVIDGISFIPLVTTTYTVTATDANACINSDQVLVTVNDPSLSPGLDLGLDQAICPGEFVQLNASGLWNSFLWSNTENTSSISVGDSGVFWCEVTNATNCVFRDSIQVTLKESPQITVLPFDTISCAPFSVNFEALSNVPNTSITWDFGDNSNEESGNVVSHIYNGTGVYDLTIVANAVGYCTSEMVLDDAIHILAQPIAFFTYNLTSSVDDKLPVQFINNSLNYTSLNWYFTDIDSSNLDSPNFEFNKTENPVITLFVSNGYCSDTETQTIEIPENLIYYVPNTFTPDGNKFNNIFSPIITEGVQLETYHLKIYNRWGELLFESYDSLVGWDGTYDGKIAKSDNYLWLIEFIELGEKLPRQITGHLTLLN
jgi:gliding motility-associated-like protein